jgi:hypothetical protein
VLLVYAGKEHHCFLGTGDGTIKRSVRANGAWLSIVIELIHGLLVLFRSVASQSPASFLNERHQPAECCLTHIEFPGEAADPQAHIEHLVDHAASIFNMEDAVRK